MNQVEVFQFMKRQRHGVVSSIAADGMPQSALVGIATTPELDVVFDTLKTSRKYANLLRHPRCSLVVGWTEGQTLQLEGMAEEPSGIELLPLQRAYFEVWPEGPSRMNWAAIAYLVVHPRWLRYSDYGQASPFIWEIKF